MNSRRSFSVASVLLGLVTIVLGPGTATAATVAAGAGHTLVVRTSDGTVWTWGDGSYGQLGSGISSSAVPIQASTLTRVVAVAAGSHHSLALKADGTVWSFGHNDRGQLGIGNNTDQATPVPVSGLTNVVAIAAGEDHSIALRSDGTVFVWGANAQGQLGDGSKTDRTTPVEVTGLRAIAIGAGGNHSLVVLNSGAVKAWGENSSHQLGDGTGAPATNPVSTSAVSGVTSVAGGLGASFARRSNGIALAWGDNSHHQLGDGTSTSQGTAVEITGLRAVSVLVAGSYHGLALTSAGNVLGWGENRLGSVGDGTTTDRLSPVILLGLANVTSVAAGRYHSVAVTAEGSVFTWGDNQAQQLGDGTRLTRTAPVKISEANFSWKVGTPTFDLPAGTYAKAEKVAISCATAGATIRYTTDGTEPTPSSATYSSPVPITVTTRLKARGFKTGLSDSSTTSAVYSLKVATPTFSPAGGSHGGAMTVAISTASPGVTLMYTTDEGEPMPYSTRYTIPLTISATTTLKARGFRSGWTDSDVATATYLLRTAASAAPATSGLVPEAAAAASGRAILVTPAAPDVGPDAPAAGIGLLSVSVGAAAASGGWGHFVVAESDGTVAAFGSNSYGALGDASGVSHRTIPGPVNTLTNVTAVAAGAYFAVALKSDGTLWSWGNNAHGQLGDNTTTSRNSPVQVSITNVAAIAAGESHVVVAKSNGEVWTWGYNGNGQLGDGTTTNRWTPVQVSGLTGVTQVTAGRFHSLALKSTGDVWAWGSNSDGQLGDGTTTGRLTPFRVDGLSSVIAVAGGVSSNFSLALRDDRTVWGWGANGFGQLGDGSTLPRLTPVRALGLSGVAAIRAGDNHTLALKTDGSVWAFGHNGSGQLGDGTSTHRSSAVQVPGLTNVATIGAGSSHSMAIDANGSVWTWGSNVDGSLGDGTGILRRSPTRVAEDDFNWKVGTPTFAWPTSVYYYAFDLTVWDATPGATIRYTTNGNESTESDATVASGGTISITQTRTIKAKAWKSGMPASNTAAETYTLVVSPPSASPGGGSYTSVQSVTLSCTTSGATIRITTDGSEPTAGSTAYSSPIAINATTTLKAKAFKSGWSDSETRTNVYTLNLGTLAAPNFSPPPGTYTTSVDVTITGPGGATIRYTTDGSEPNQFSSVYSSALTFTATTTLKARAFSASYTQSATTTGVYTIKVAAPPLSPGTGTYSIGQVVTASASGGVTVRYTVGGGDPTESHGVFPSGGLTLVATSTIKVRGFKAGCTPSDVTSHTYTITGSTPSGGVWAGASHSGAWTGSGGLWTWGANGNGQLGIGNTTASKVPVSVSISDVSALDGGLYHTVALKTNGEVWSWGYNGYGQLGDNTTTQRTSPVQVSGLNATSVAAGTYHSLAASGGVAYAWGHNGNGRLGDSTTTDRPTPVPVNGLSGITVTAVAAGYSHSLALGSNGKVYAWGANQSGQLGDNTNTQRTSAVEVSSLTGVVAIAAGAYHSLALTSAGLVYGWGNNGYGMVGDGTTNPRWVPTQVVNLTGVRTIAAGYNHSLAATTDGSAWAWGHNGAGQLGGGPWTGSSSPISVTGQTGVVALAAGDNHSLAMDEDGAIWGWGFNSNGELGDGTTEGRLQPIRLSDSSFAWNVATPTFSPGGGTSYYTAPAVTVSCVTAGATIHYTTDGSTPTTSHPTVASGGTVNVTQSLTLMARAFKSGMPPSNVASASYTLNVVTPQISPGQATYTTPQSVTLSTTTSGATIRYTTDGTEPTEASTVYSSPIAVNSTLMLKAKAWKAGWAESTQTSASYTMKVGTPQLSPGGGAYGAAQTVTVTTTTPSAVLHYSTSGLEPTESDAVVASGGTVLVNQSATLRVKAWKAGGWTTSDTTTATYQINLGTAATPAFSPAAGTYTAVQVVTISTATAGATIRYTLDGSDPIHTSLIYRAPITVDATATVKARAFKRDWTKSATGSAAYTIDLANTVAPVQYSPPAGTYPTTQTITLTTSTSGATIHYTTDGDEPTTSDPSVSSGGTVNVDRGLSLKTLAVKSGMTASPIRRADYAITGAIAGGYRYAFGLKVDATLWGWGYNDYGQVGNGSTGTVATPVPVLSGARQVSTNGGSTAHTMAVKWDGSLWGWGNNNHGVLGDGTTTQRLSPVETSNPSGHDFVAVATGDYHSLAVRDNGQVYAWGYNSNGQLGNDSTTNSLTPVPVNLLLLSDVVAVAAGTYHSLALTKSGQVYAWGYNGNGQLGDGTTTSRDEPVLVASLAGVTAIAAGGNHSLALRADGSEKGDVWVWGAYVTQPLWDLIGNTTVPVRILSGVDALSSNYAEVLYLRRDTWSQGSIWGSGIHNGDKLTAGLPSTTNYPQRIGVSDYVAVSAGLYSSLAIRRDTTVVNWGNSGYTGGNGLVLGYSTGTDDPDGDGLSTNTEWLIGTDPWKADTNGDGVRDGQALASGKSPTNRDMDGDGVTNSVELGQGTDPFNTDTDGDTYSDSADCFPLDPTRWNCPSPTGGDTTPPVITLTEPTNANLISVVPPL